MKYIATWLFVFVLQSLLHADIVTLTVSALTGQTNTTQFVVQTNVTAKILHLHDPTAIGGYLTIQVNGLNFKYSESTLINAGNNTPIIIGPATMTLTALVPPSVQRSRRCNLHI